MRCKEYHRTSAKRTLPPRFRHKNINRSERYDLLDGDHMKDKLKIPPETVDKLMVSCGHRCCLGHEIYNQNYPLDIHHLDENRENNDPDNLMPLCKNCHLGKVHATFPFGRKYTIRELKQLRDEWYESIKMYKEEAAKSASSQLDESAHLMGYLEFYASFSNSEISYGEKSHIKFQIINSANRKVKLLNYQFYVYYLLFNRLIPYISFSKHHWDLKENEIPAHDSLLYEFDDVDPVKAYLSLNKIGEWIIRISIDYTYNERYIGTIYSDAILKII